MEGKTKTKKEGLCMWLCGFNNIQGQWMFQQRERGRWGGMERKTQTEKPSERRAERETVQHEEDSRTNSAPIVHVAWLTF